MKSAIVNLNQKFLNLMTLEERQQKLNILFFLHKKRQQSLSFIISKIKFYCFKTSLDGAYFFCQSGYLSNTFLG